MNTKILRDLGKWSSEYDEKGVCIKAVYDEAYRRLLGIDTLANENDNDDVWKTIVHPDDIGRIETNAVELFAKHPEGYDYDLEYRMMTPNGYHWFHDFAHCTRRKDGSVSRMDGVIFDIQDIVDKEAAQKELTENYTRILALEDNFEALFDIDLESGHFVSHVKGNLYRDKIQDKLPGGTNYFKTLRANIDSVIYPEDRDGLFKTLSKENILKELAENEHIDYYYRINAEKAPIWMKLRIVYKDSEKKNIIIGSFNAENDVEAKQIAAQKIQLEEALEMAQSANRAKTTFLNNMSHDIRTPMNAIIGYTALAASHMDNKELIKDYLTKIAQSSDHLLSLINDVLDMSRIESGKMNLEEKPENLSDIVHILRNIIQADVQARRLNFQVDVIDVTNENVICDKLRLNQILLNLLSNSVKYTTAGGTVTLQVIEKAIKDNGWATFEFRVKDNGIGMDKEFLKTIFDPFTRVRSSTVSGIQGTGLGMTITKKIIDMMKGTIDIASEPGKGTEVTICFDFKLQDTQSKSGNLAELKGVRALVVDDDTNTCLSISNMLKDLGMRYEWCTSGNEAVIRADAAHRGGDTFKVYFIDWSMPYMNGVETTRRIRKVLGDDVPIIIQTAYDWADIEEEAREAGVTAFVSKPLFPSDLHRVLNNCLSKTEEIPQAKKEDFDFTGKRILLVEDNALNREIAQEILSDEGLVVQEAEDGSKAVELLKTKGTDAYDFILMDIQMPVMNGYEATKAIRALPGGDRIPIIALSANAFEEDRQKSLAAGMNAHIAKPIKIKELFSTLAKFL